MTSESPAAQLARLAAENGALNEQVKLLVQVEHRLSRSQSSLDRQLTRIKALNVLALECARDGSPEAVLVRTATLISESFYVDQVVAATIGADQRTLALTDGGAPAVLDPALATWLATQPCALLGPEPMVLALLEAIGLPPPPAAGLVAILPLCQASGALAGIVVALATGAVTGFHLERLHETHRSFLQLVTTHAEQAMRAATLTADLRQSSATLAAANDTIRESMQQLAAAQKMEAIGRLAGGVAHDFNNLLTVILGHCELVLPKLDGSPLHDDVTQIADAARQAADITRQLLTFGRKQGQNRTELDLNEVTMGMSRLLGRVIGAQVTLHLDLDPQLPRVRVDRVQIEQALLNLAINARDAMHGRGAITLGTRTATPADLRRAGLEPGATQVLLYVRDTGTGMDEPTQARIFEPFFTTKQPGEGTGLGLAIVYGVSAQNDGQVMVDSQLGVGTTFSLLFPAHAARSAPAIATVRDQLATVLVVDDERRILDFASRVLRDAGYHVLGVPSGPDALNAASTCAIDLLVTDVVMPGLSGVDLAHALRADQPELPVLFMSGHTFDALDPGELANGRGSFLPKPFTPDDLRRRVARALSAR